MFFGVGGGGGCKILTKVTKIKSSGKVTKVFFFIIKKALNSPHFEGKNHILNKMSFLEGCQFDKEAF
jgi:hypothetical protein